MKTVLLIGTNHAYQHPGTHGEKFRVVIEESCQQYAIMLIAEEMSLDALQKWEHTESICKQVADALGIPHVYCDPSVEEQIALGIKKPGKERDPEADAIREHYWLEHLLKQNTCPVLFICGPDHIESFRDLLRENDIAVRVLCKRWRRPEDWLL